MTVPYLTSGTGRFRTAAPRSVPPGRPPPGAATPGLPPRTPLPDDAQAPYSHRIAILSCSNRIGLPSFSRSDTIASMNSMKQLTPGVEAVLATAKVQSLDCLPAVRKRTITALHSGAKRAGISLSVRTTDEIRWDERVIHITFFGRISK